MRRLWLWGWLLCLSAALGQEQPDAFQRVVSQAQRRIAADEAAFAQKWLEKLETLAPHDVRTP